MILYGFLMRLLRRFSLNGNTLTYCNVYFDHSQNLDDEVNKMASFLGLSLTTDFCQNLDLESVLSPEEPKRKRQRTDNTENHLNFNNVECRNLSLSLLLSLSLSLSLSLLVYTVEWHVGV